MDAPADAEALLDRVRDRTETPLARLGSSKALYAVTGGEMDARAVRAAVADDAAAAAALFESWADSPPPAGDAFADAAARAAESRDSVAPDDHDPATDGALADGLAGLDDPVARAAGALARALVVGARTGQAVGFFVGDADPRAADEVRAVRRGIDTDRDDALALLDALCTDADDWTRAESVAVEAVEAAYDDYVARLEAMGVEPKNVC